MRNAFIKAFTEIAEADANAMLITGDLGFGVLTEFAQKYPHQYLNAGVAEQNMTSLAVGLALEGKTVYTYSIGNFPTLRCLEQIRNDACYHDANVKIVTIGGGFAYGPLGISHHATEDLAIMRSLPNLRVFAPGDPLEVEAVTRLSHKLSGPCYLRLGRGGEPVVHQKMPALELGRAIKIHRQGKIALLSAGGMLPVAVETRDLLRQRGIEAALYSFPTVKPLDTELVSRLAREHELVATLEEHSVVGGFGSSVAEVVSELAGSRARVVRCGLLDQFSSVVGTQEFLRHTYGIDAPGISEKLYRLVAGGS